jgi:hypothetical protein
VLCNLKEAIFFFKNSFFGGGLSKKEKEKKVRGYKKKKKKKKKKGFVGLFFYGCLPHKPGYGRWYLHSDMYYLF